MRSTLPALRRGLTDAKIRASRLCCREVELQQQQQQQQQQQLKRAELALAHDFPHLATARRKINAELAEVRTAIPAAERAVRYWERLLSDTDLTKW
jgi:hypothetical protein